MALKVFFEGDPALRIGFLSFFEKLVPSEVKIDPIACKSKPIARFLDSLPDYSDDLCILLIDADKIVGGDRYRNENLAALLIEKTDDGRLEKIDPALFHFMIIEMEAWFLLDAKALQDFYKEVLQKGKLPKSKNIELVTRDKVWSSLRGATRGTYHKTRHAPGLLALLNPSEVGKRAPHCQILIDFIRSKYNNL